MAFFINFANIFYFFRLSFYCCSYSSASYLLRLIFLCVISTMLSNFFVVPTIAGLWVNELYKFVSDLFGGETFFITFFSITCGYLFLGTLKLNSLTTVGLRIFFFVSSSSIKSFWSLAKSGIALTLTLELLFLSKFSSALFN
jgi:hypothetical protein